MKVRILHLSDLHVNTSEREHLELVANGLINDLRIFCDRGKAPDLVCITGDLINKGENSTIEFDLAERLFLEPISKCISIPREQFFLIPGNHEINRQQESESFESGLTSQLCSKDALRAFRKAFMPGRPDYDSVTRKLAGFTENKYSNVFTIEQDFFYSVAKVELQGKGTIGVLGLNSAWRCSQFGHDHKKLIIGEDIITKAVRRIQGCDIRVCLCHHPFEMLSEWDARDVSRKVMQNFHLLLNGHVHDSFGVSGNSVWGTLFMSTSGSLRPHDPFSSYTLLEADVEEDTITCEFRKWYQEREVFDEDLSKHANGRMVISGLRARSQSSLDIDTVAIYRSKLQLRGLDNTVVCPIDDIETVNLQSVFVEPVLYDAPSYERDRSDPKTLSLSQLLNSSDNIVFYGRPEFGKTTLLRYAQEMLLSDYRQHGDRVPVCIRFGDISPKNYNQIFRVIQREIDGATEAKLKILAEAGKLVLLVDDYDDREDEDRLSKSKVLREFSRMFPRCRFILSTTEHLSQHIRMELFSIAAEYQAIPCHIANLNTSRLRLLISKWSEYQPCDVDAVLKQVLYYFKHLQIPVTPLAATLFVGVLFRKKKDRNIRNEALLIENYFETLLEKLHPTRHEGVLEFRDKEDFLAFVALEMFRRRSFEWSVNDFERAKLNYFESYDEEVPDPRFFEAFVRKGILFKSQGMIGFRRRTWFHFFLAKAMERDAQVEDEVLGAPDVLMFSKALAYKAALVRNDLKLLTWIDRRAQNLAKPLLEEFAGSELRGHDFETPLQNVTAEIKQELTEKNTTAQIDSHRDELYLNYEEDNGQVSDEVVDQFGELLALQSDVIRNTARISTAQKRNFIANNVKCYVALMWGSLGALKSMFKETPEEELIDVFFRGRKDATDKQKLNYILELCERIVKYSVPLSLVLFMTEHLGNPRMLRSYSSLLETVTTETERLFFAILIFSQDPHEGLRQFRKIVKSGSSRAEEFLIYGFIRFYCRDNKITNEMLDKVVEFLDYIRRKYATKAKVDLPFLKDDYRSTTKHELRVSNWK